MPEVCASDSVSASMVSRSRRAAVAEVLRLPTLATPSWRVGSYSFRILRRTFTSARIFRIFPEDSRRAAAASSALSTKSMSSSTWSHRPASSPTTTPVGRVMRLRLRFKSPWISLIRSLALSRPFTIRSTAAPPTVLLSPDPALSEPAELLPGSELPAAEPPSGSGTERAILAMGPGSSPGPGSAIPSASGSACSSG